jgi:hypothetical protein
MPIKRKQGETKDEFITRCIPIEIKSGKSSDQAAAICYSTWDEKQLSAVKRIRNKKYKAGVPHYTADGILWTGPTHKDASGRLMTGETHTEDSEYLYHEDELKNLSFESYTDYPKAAIQNAQAALNWAEKNGWGSCGTPVGKARANQLAKGEAISEETISRMAAFERHRQNSQKDLGDGCGRLMWLAWGGDEGVEWASRKLKQIRGENFEKIRVGVLSSNVDRMMWNSETLELVIRFNDGSTYTYVGVDEKRFLDVSEGNAAPKTKDYQVPPRWIKDQKPSVGAAVHKWLIKKGFVGTEGGTFR